MKALLLLTIALAPILPIQGQDNYPLTPDSKVQEGVPKGEVLKFTFDKSTIFPGTSREFWLYVPRQYDPAKPACVYVNQDGIQWNAPTVFDNLIHKGEMPITIGVFVRPGVVPAANANALPRFNRSFEYDGLGDNYARFLLEELLPEVERQKTPDGRAIVLSKNGNDRAIGGSSSGAIAAFTAAWERPDAFSRVFSAIGTYVGLRGGNEYPTLIRKMEPKPLRIFLQGGSNDNNIYGGDWWMANQEMQRALTFAGYEVNHVWGTGGHNGTHGTQVFPDAMRYLWKDWPQPVKPGLGSPQLKDILTPGEDWKGVEVGEGFQWYRSNLVVGDKGSVIFAGGKMFLNGSQVTISHWDATQNKFLTTNQPEKILQNWGFRLATGPSGETLGVHSGKIESIDGKDKKVWTDATFPEEFLSSSSGSLYYLETAPYGGQAALTKYDVLPVDIWHISPQGQRKIVVPGAGISKLSRIALSTDQTLLYISIGKWVYSYQIQPDGSLAHKQKYYHLHVPDDANSAEVGGMCVDRDGRLYVATAMGIQVCDQAGRVNCIIPVPGGAAQSIVLGGADFDTLFVASGSKIYKRKVKTKGAPSFLPPIKPAPPRL